MKPIPYSEWIDSTKLRLRRRSKELLGLDQAIEFYGKKPTPEALLVVKQTFEIWQRATGAGWRNSPRNHRGAMNRLDNELQGHAGPAADMDNARLGVLYLFGNTKIHYHVGGFLLETALATKAGIGEVKDALHPGPDCSTWGDWKKSYDPWSAAGREGASVTTPLLDTRDEIAREKGWSLGRIHELLLDFANRIAKHVAEEYQKIRDQPAAIFDCDAAVSAAKNLILVLAQHIWKSVKDQVGGLAEVFKGLVNTTDAVCKKIKAAWLSRGVLMRSGHPAAICETLESSMTWDMGRGLYDLCKGVLLTAATGLGAVGGALVGLLVSALEAITKLIWRTMEVRAIRRILDQAAGFWRDYRRGAAAAGALHQPTNLTRGTGLLAGEKMKTSAGFHTDVAGFHPWFRTAVLQFPLLAALALTSGICGDKMRFIDMMTYDLTGAGQGGAKKRFMHDVTYLDYLKSYSRVLLDRSSFKLYSPLPDVNAYIAGQAAFTHLKQDNRIGAVDFIKKLANA